MKIGHTIRMLRTAKKVSQGDLAQQLAVTPGYLSLVEQDKREPSLGFLDRVGEYFDLPVGFLMLGDADGRHVAPEHRRIIDEIQRAMLAFLVARPTRPIVRRRKAAKK